MRQFKEISHSAFSRPTYSHSQSEVLGHLTAKGPFRTPQLMKSFSTPTSSEDKMVSKINAFKWKPRPHRAEALSAPEGDCCQAGALCVWQMRAPGGGEGKSDG